MALAVGRPLRVGVVPIVAGSDLFRVSDGGIHNPQVAALVVKTQPVSFELVREVAIVGGTSLLAGVRARSDRWGPPAAQGDELAGPSGDHWNTVTPFFK